MQTATETCPLCGTELSRVKFEEIEAKMKEEERARLPLTPGWDLIGVVERLGSGVSELKPARS